MYMNTSLSGTAWIYGLRAGVGLGCQALLHMELLLQLTALWLLLPSLRGPQKHTQLV